MNFLPIYSKLISESLLSLYPIFVKKINLPLDLQLWIRLITYILISLFFINYSWISLNIFTSESLLLSLINMLHIYSSYNGFLILDSGVAFSIFNIYPLLILLLSGVTWRKEYFYSVIGLIFFIFSNFIYGNRNNTDLTNFAFGFGMMIVAAITEAIIYFIIKKIKTDNSWNHLFIAYFMGSILMSLYVFKDYLIGYFNSDTSNDYIKLENENIDLENNINLDTNNQKKINSKNIGTVGLALVINGLIGTIGYLLRFFSIYKLEPGIYSVLSYFGIIMAYIYGIIFNEEKLDWLKVIGTFFIILSNYLIS